MSFLERSLHLPWRRKELMRPDCPGAAATIVATTAAQQGDAATSSLITSVVETSINSLFSNSFVTFDGNSGTSGSEMLAATQRVSSINLAISE